MHKHFLPVFNGINVAVVQDCKLSHLAYGLVLMNADGAVDTVGQFQISVLEKYLRDGQVL